MFCHVAPECVMAVHDCKSVYHVPLLLKEQGLLDVLQQRLKLEPKLTHDAEVLMVKWNKLAQR
jgi:CTP synthase